MEEKTPTHNQEESPGIVSKIMKLAAYPIAIIAGLWVTKLNVEDAAYDRLKARGGFERKDSTNPSKIDIQPLHKEMHSNILREAERNAVAGIPNSDFAKKAHEIDKAYHPHVEKRFEELGLAKIKDKWTYLSRSQRQNAVEKGLTVSAIAIGAMLTMADSKTISHLFSEKDKNKNAETGRSA